MNIIQQYIKFVMELVGDIKMFSRKGHLPSSLAIHPSHSLLSLLFLLLLLSLCYYYNQYHYYCSYCSYSYHRSGHIFFQNIC